MKSFLLSVLLLAEILKCPAQETIKLNALTKKEKKNYSLQIIPVKKVNDKCNPKSITFLANAFLKNNSNDTLIYINWTCGENIWYSDNKGF